MWKKLALFQQITSFQLPRKPMHLTLVGGVTACLVVIVGAVLNGSKGALFSVEAVPHRQVVQAAQSIRFTIYPEGILPATATAHKGAISISIEDLAGADSGVLVERLDDRGPANAGNVQRFQRHWRGRSLLELSPGVYRLRVPGKQTREALLTVEP